MNTGSIEAIGKYFRAKSSPPVSLFILIIAVCSINAWQLILPNFSHDNSFCIAAAKNIYDGKGYTLTNISEQDLSVTTYEPLNKWPPGYSWLLALVKKITHTDWTISCYILNGIGATLLMLALRKIMLLLQIPGRIVNIYLLFTGFVPYPFLSTWFSDLLAAAFFMWGIALLLQLVLKNKNQFIYAIASGLFLGFCAWLKYLYLSVSPIPFIFLLFYAFRTRNIKIAKALACGGFFLLVSLGYMLWFQQHHTGAAFYINPTGRGLFPKNVLHIGPIVPGSLLDFKLYDMQLSATLDIPYLKMLIFWKWLNIFLLFAILFLVIRFFREPGVQFEKPLNTYMCLALAVSISICLLLGFLSLTQAPFTNRFTAFWTYVEELRYYAVILLFIPQGILFLIFYRSHLLSYAKKPFIASIIAVVAIQISHGFYYLPKQVFVKKEVGKNRQSEQLYFLALKTASRLLELNKNLVICSDGQDISNISSLSGIPALYNYDRLNRELRSSKPLTLFVILNEPVLPYFKHFFSTYNPTLLYTYRDIENSRGVNFYMVKIL